jgi:hypothetical protein
MNVLLLSLTFILVAAATIDHVDGERAACASPKVNRHDSRIDVLT